MDEIVPGVWIGDLTSALDTEGLKTRNIHSILTAMRGKVTIHATFTTHQVNIDDSEEEDVLVHFLPSIAFIQKQLAKGRGVLVHCQAGISRSATIVAAYLMYTLHVDPTTALDLIKKVRPNVEPNEGFLQQLQVFHEASYNISRKDKVTRMFYMERTVEEVMNGDGEISRTDMFAKYPRTPNDSTPPTPAGPRRRIRCKMCRQELATREHMLDHGQLGPPTPAYPTLTPAASRRPSMNDYVQAGNGSRRPSTSVNVSISRRPSSNGSRSRLGSLSNFNGDPIGLASSIGLSGRGLLESLSMSALDTEDDSEAESVEGHQGVFNHGSITELTAATRSRHSSDTKPFRPSPLSMEGIGQDLSDALDAALSSTGSGAESGNTLAGQISRPLSPVTELDSNTPSSASDVPLSPPAPSSQYANAMDLAAQLQSHPKLAGLRSPILTSVQNGSGRVAISPPILANPKCSGYFLEPMKWMEPFLESGQLAGKILCPNKKCGVKLGTYDWAGVCCSCKEWVTPGFCIHRSKVDEVI